VKAKTRTAVIVLLIVTACSAFAQICNHVAVVRPVHHQKTVDFLTSLSDSMKRDGYDEAAEMLKSYASGGYGSGFVYVAADGSKSDEFDGAQAEVKRQYGPDARLYRVNLTEVKTE
jgi:hypothetical protein